MIWTSFALVDSMIHNRICTSPMKLAERQLQRLYLTLSLLLTLARTSQCSLMKFDDLKQNSNSDDTELLREMTRPHRHFAKHRCASISPISLFNRILCLLVDLLFGRGSRSSALPIIHANEVPVRCNGIVCSYSLNVVWASASVEPRPSPLCSDLPKSTLARVPHFDVAVSKWGMSPGAG
jgi:hypothetical protein